MQWHCPKSLANRPTINLLLLVNFNTFPTGSPSLVIEPVEHKCTAATCLCWAWFRIFVVMAWVQIAFLHGNSKDEYFPNFMYFGNMRNNIKPKSHPLQWPCRHPWNFLMEIPKNMVMKTWTKTFEFPRSFNAATTWSKTVFFSIFSTTPMYRNPNLLATLEMLESGLQHTSMNTKPLEMAMMAPRGASKTSKTHCCSVYPKDWAPQAFGQSVSWIFS